MIEALLLVVLALGGGARAPDQAPPDTLRGVVVSRPDSVPVAGARVVLHRVTPDTGLAVDSVRSGTDGRFAFVLRRRSEDVFLASVRHQGVLYFGPAVHGPELPDDYRVAVSPSREARAEERPAVARRTLVVSAEGDRLRMLDAVDVTGTGDTTLVGRGGEGAAWWWRIVLPRGVQDVRVLPGGVAPEEVELSAGEARVSAAVPAGGQRLLLGYEAGSGEAVTLAPDQSVERFDLVVRGDDPAVTVEGLGEGRSSRIAEGTVGRYSARGLGAGDTIRVTLARSGGGEGTIAAWIAAGVGSLLAIGAVLAWRRIG